MKSQRLNWKKSDTFIRVWHELAGDSVTAHWLVRTLDENKVARMLFRKGPSKGRGGEPSSLLYRVNLGAVLSVMLRLVMNPEGCAECLWHVENVG